jgi:hypothetical protein
MAAGDRERGRQEQHSAHAELVLSTSPAASLRINFCFAERLPFSLLANEGQAFD